jgi:hypothetical protein
MFFKRYCNIQISLDPVLEMKLSEFEIDSESRDMKAFNETRSSFHLAELPLTRKVRGM